MSQPNEFYIGWEAKAAPGICKAVRKVVVVLLLLALAASVVLAISQRMIGASVFEWGTHKTFAGILQTTPYPHLLVPRPGNANGFSSFSTYYLVAPWKFGLKPEAIASLAGKSVTLKGTLIYRGNQTMIEVLPDSIQVTNIAATTAPPEAVPLGIQVAGPQVVLTVPTSLGHTSQIERADSLTAPAWTPMGGSMMGTGATISITNTMTNAPRFFRVNSQ